MIANMIEKRIPIRIDIDFKTDFESEKDKIAKQNTIEMALNRIYQDAFIPKFSKYIPNLMAVINIAKTR